MLFSGYILFAVLLYYKGIIKEAGGSEVDFHCLFFVSNRGECQLSVDFSEFKNIVPENPYNYIACTNFNCDSPKINFKVGP